MTLNPDSPLSEVLANRAARALVQNYLPGIVNSPMLHQLKALPVKQVIGMNASLSRADELDKLWQLLSAVPEEGQGRIQPVAWEEPRQDYEPELVARGSAPLRHADTVPRWDVLEIGIEGPTSGNPFTDVSLAATFVRTDAADRTEQRIGGFYDGDGAYKIRFMPAEPGEWTFSDHSNARSLDGLTGSFLGDRSRCRFR
jgi:hypothetical protein